MKKEFISFLVIALTLTNISLVNISSVQAATTDNSNVQVPNTDNTLKVSLENIKEIMIENNLDIKILYDKVKIQKEKYNDSRDAYVSAKEDKATKKTAYDNAKTDYDKAVALNDGTDATALGNLNKADIASTNADTAYANADKALTNERDALKTVRDAYEQGIEDKVYAAQDAYIKYLSNLSNEKLKEDTVKSNEKQEQVYKLQYEKGFISKNKYTSLLQGNTTPVNELEKLRDDEELARIKLCNTLGISPQKHITFETNITENLEKISKINYENDFGQMLSNNIDIKLKNDEINDLNDAEDDYDNDNIYDYKVNTVNTELKLLMNNTETSFKGQYNTLINSYNSIKSSFDKLNEDEKSYNIIKTKYNYGFASKKDVDDKKLTLDKERSDFDASKNQLYVNYLRYLQMKEGY